jgi:hypothetical protein
MGNNLKTWKKSYEAQIKIIIPKDFLLQTIESIKPFSYLAYF